MSEGHPEAWKYPIGFMWTEARIARERINIKMATESVLIQQAVLSIWSGDKDGIFRKTIGSLQNGG
jgi:hypothetical protein